MPLIAGAGEEGNSRHRMESEVFRRAVQEVSPCVVTIHTVGGTQPAEQRGAAGAFIVAEGPATGLIWSSDGLILTSSFNFVRDPSVITVALPDGSRHVAELIARDEVRRLAMLRIEATGLPVPKWVTEPGGIRVGQWALAIGRGHAPGADAPASSLLADCSITAGIVSGLNRMSGLAIGTDARVSPANFGGPLIDIQGRVLGICVPLGLSRGEMAGVEWYDSGIGFAIPHAQVAAAAKDLAVGHSLRYGLLGIAVDRRAADAVIVAGIADPSPALRSGLREGDRIVGVDDEPVQLFRDLERALRPRHAGRWVDIRLIRDGREMTIPVMLGVPDDIGTIPLQGPPETEPVDTEPAEPENEGEE